MSQIRILPLSVNHADYVAQLPPLFAKMYQEMALNSTSGKLMLGLAEDGENIWLEGLKKLLGRFAFVMVAVDGEKVVGFIHAFISFTPDYLGALKIGTIGHLFVLPDIQKQGIGKQLLLEMEELLAEKDLNSISLQVISGNIPAIGFWKKMGYKEELLQFRKFRNIGH
jgi:ribosomal protein S18 acetylase RimI-like enzyme